jgi:hypothetical protein
LLIYRRKGRPLACDRNCLAFFEQEARLVVGAQVAFVDDPKHWRDRAAEVRRVAETMNDPRARAEMLKIAQDYDRLAVRAEDRLRAGGN